jgi:nitronate monooxygenase
MAQVDADELAEMLNTLLEAERAGARVGAALIAEAQDTESETLARTIHDDEVKWAKVLFEAVTALGSEPSDKVGDFYEKAMAIDGFEERVAFVNRGQGWVVRKLRELIPHVGDPGLAGVLQEMLDAHVINITTANRVLEARGAA